MVITSDTNPKIKLLLKLKQSKYRKSNGLFIVEGSHLVKEARMKNRLVEAYSINEQEGYITLTEDLMKKVASTDTVVKEIGLCKIEENHELSNKILMLSAIRAIQLYMFPSDIKLHIKQLMIGRTSRKS